MDWMKTNGASIDKVELRQIELPGSGRPLDHLVAAQPLKAGDVALQVPKNLIITLDRVFESDFVAELLTTDKLSELACLTLYLMYEKKVGKESSWYRYIKELDKLRARGPQAVESPLLWDNAELEDLLQGSPLVAAVKARLAGIEKEYRELDTVWFMAGSLFNRYPFDLPTEAFSFRLFKQAFAAVQASIVHLQGVELSRRFCLVPLGPPLLAYSSTCKALLSYDAATQGVKLVVDRDYEAGSPIYAWCGPQPNTRLLLNYGIVDESNPYDKLQLTLTLTTADPLYQAKRSQLQAAGLSVVQTFDISAKQPLPPLMLPWMRLAHASDASTLSQISLTPDAVAKHPALEAQAVTHLCAYLRQRLRTYKRPLWQDLEVIHDPSSSPREKVAARLTKIEKTLLTGCLEALVPGGAAGSLSNASQASDMEVLAQQPVKISH